MFCLLYFIESEELFGKAMKDGSVSVKMINALILGEAGVGKTSTKCILFNEPPPKDRTSTSLADELLCARVSSPKPLIRPKNVSEVKVRSVANHWKALNDKQLQEIVADAIAAISTEVEEYKCPKLLTPNTTQHQVQPPVKNQSVTSFLTSSRVSKSMPPPNKQITIKNINGKMVVEENCYSVSSSCHEESNRIGSNWALTIIDLEGGKFHFRNILPQIDDTETSNSMDDQVGKILPAKDNVESIVAHIHSNIMDLINKKKSKRPSIQSTNEIFWLQLDLLH